jgi:hypothetical protein
MFRPVIDREFGVTGELTWSDSGTEQVINYWYRTPYFWRIEKCREVEFISGHTHHAVLTGADIERFRLLAKPVFFADKFGLHIAPGESVPTTHGPTGRPAILAALDGTQGGSVVIDAETIVVLSLSDGKGLNIETREFQVSDSMEASIFGEETLETPGFYYGYLEGN